MATTKDYRDYILEQLNLLDNITCKSMMGEYLLYYNGVLFGGIYDDRLLIKIVDSNKKYNMQESIPYENVYEGDIPLFEAFLNLLIFVPFGIYLKMVGLSNKRIILSGFSLSLIFEISQYFFKLGATDITDLITNTFGTVVGLYAYVLLCRIIKNNTYFLILPNTS